MKLKNQQRFGFEDCLKLRTLQKKFMFEKSADDDLAEKWKDAIRQNK